MKYVKHAPDNSFARNPTGLTGSPILPPGFRRKPSPGNCTEKEIEIARKICVFVEMKMLVTVAAIRSNLKSACVIRAREISMSLIRELTKLSNAETGMIHRKKHTTVVNACQRVKALCLVNPSYACEYKMLLDEARKLIQE